MPIPTDRPSLAHDHDTIEFRTGACPYCGQHGSVRVTLAGHARRAAGELVQDAFPDMPVGLREQIISGTHPACFDALFAEEPAGAVLMSEIFGPDDGPTA